MNRSKGVNGSKNLTIFYFVFTGGWLGSNTPFGGGLALTMARRSLIPASVVSIFSSCWPMKIMGIVSWSSRWSSCLTSIGNVSPATAFFQVWRSHLAENSSAIRTWWWDSLNPDHRNRSVSLPFSPGRKKMLASVRFSKSTGRFIMRCYPCTCIWWSFELCYLLSNTCLTK